jgi:hypothetical protein
MEKRMAGALKRALAGTTALIGPALLISPLLIAPLAARAANITISALGTGIMIHSNGHRWIQNE